LEEGSTQIRENILLTCNIIRNSFAKQELTYFIGEIVAIVFQYVISRDREARTNLSQKIHEGLKRTRSTILTLKLLKLDLGTEIDRFW